MNAIILRYVLIGVMVVMVAIFSVGGWFVQQLLSERVRDTEHVRIQSEIATLELQQLRKLEVQLAQDQDVIQRARQIAATSAQYKYQDQVISDITKYASRYGIRIESFNFETKAKSSSKKGTKTTPSDRTPFSVSLAGSIPYETFLRFMRDIETNLTKIQVTSLTLSPDENPALVANPTLSLEVYIKK